MNRDPYLYPDSDVLVNKLGIRDKDELAKRESALVRLREPQASRLSGPMNLERLHAVHKILFSDVFEWAGTPRQNTGTMEKWRDGGYFVRYGDSAHVQAQLQIVFSDLAKENYLKGLSADQFANRLAHFYTELDSVHCYREGNSRTLRRFTADLAKEAGHQLNWSKAIATEADRQKLYCARDFGVMRGESNRLASIIGACLEGPVMERNAPDNDLEMERAAPTSKSAAKPKRARTKGQGIDR